MSISELRGVFMDRIIQLNTPGGTLWSELPTFTEDRIIMTYVKYDCTLDNAIMRHKVKKTELCWQLLRLFINMWKRGLVHCDIKPANIGCIIFNAGAYNIAHPQLADCMQSHLHVPGGINACTNIQTPEYMPPESIIAKLSGKPKIIDQSIDIFALGLVLYEVLYTPRIHKKYPDETRRMEATMTWFFTNIYDPTIVDTEYARFMPAETNSNLKRTDLLHTLVADMLRFDPRARITVDGLISKIGAANLILPTMLFTNRDIDISISAVLIAIIDAIKNKISDVRIRAIAEFYAHYLAYHNFRLNRNSVYGAESQGAFLEDQYCYIAYMYSLSLVGSNIPNILIQKTPFGIDRKTQISLYISFSKIISIYPIIVNATTEKYIEINERIRADPNIVLTDPNTLLA